MIYTNYKHLYISEDKEEIIYLGYRLKLTKSEYKILKILTKNPKKPIPAEQIANQCELDCSKESIVYYISSINSKAKVIGNRILIKNIAKKGYFLNDKM
ncbi:MAG: winged helix-turn-helix domain-containing protein [Clostridia bacterium]|nr:winged helix-turn-helix domain-containing protein [Clostridia bacterium]